MINYLQHTNITLIITIPPLTIQNTPMPTLRTYYSRKEPLLTSTLALPHTSNQTLIPSFVHSLSNTLTPLYTTYPPACHLQSNIPPTKIPKAQHIANLLPNITPTQQPPIPVAIHNKHLTLTFPTC